jgi:hypothetical protein
LFIKIINIDTLCLYINTWPSRLQRISMNKVLRNTLFSAALGSAFLMPAQAGVLTYQGVTFTSTWSDHVLTLEIDAAGRTGDWSTATGLAALGIKGIGAYTSVSVTATPKGAMSWTTSGAEMNASGCSASSKGAAGSRLCVSGQQIALADNMVFTFSFTGAKVTAADPHIKVEFVDAKGNKAGSLLSQTLLPSTSTGTSAGGGASIATIAATTMSDTGPSETTTPLSSATPSLGATSSAAADIMFTQSVPPASDLATSLTIDTPLQAGGGTPAAATPSGDVPEPESAALLLGGLALMGLVLRRRKS